MRPTELKFTALDLKRVEPDGTFAGYASLFNREDLGGDLILPGAFRDSLRQRASTVAKHAAILATPTTMIHAFEGAPVSEVALSPWWRRRLAAAFRFPERIANRE